MSIQTVNDECVQVGFIKLKWSLDDTRELHEHKGLCYAETIGLPRVSQHHVYLQLGHTDLPGNGFARDVLAVALATRAKVTRIDFFADFESPFAYDGYYALMNTGKPPKPSLIKSPDGCTLYVGKRASPLMLRVYNKRAEILRRRSVDIGYDLTRIELEVKRLQVPRFLTLFMNGDTMAILQDIQERYQLRNFCKRAKPARARHDKAQKTSALAFVVRHRRLIRDAYLESPSEFFDTIGVEQNGVIW